MNLNPIPLIKSLLGIASSQIITTSGGAVLGSEPGIEKYTNPIATPDDYREMRKSPTIAIGRAIIGAAICSPAWMIEADDEISEDAKSAVDAFANKLRPDLVDLFPYTLDYGFQTARTPWTYDEAGQMVIERVKPIKPEGVRSIEIFENSGRIASVTLEEKSEKVEAANILVLTYDGEGGEPFGRSRFENLREYAFNPWKEWITRMGDYAKKAAGVIPVLTHPQGEATTQTGQKINNSVIAKQIIDNLAKCRGIAIPIELVPFAQDLLKQGAKYEDLMAWKLTFVTAASGFGSEALDSVKHFESLQLRGLFVPERAAVEGQFGTRAEAGEHADIMIKTAEDTTASFIRQINQQIIDRFIVYNFGESLRGKIRVKAAPISDDAREIIKAVLIPYLNGNPDVVETALSVNDMADALKLPKAKDVVDPATDDNAGDSSEPNPTTKLSRSPRDLLTFLKREEAKV